MIKYLDRTFKKEQNEINFKIFKITYFIQLDLYF